MIVSIDNYSEFTKEVLNSSSPVLVMFWTTWSGPSKALMPTVDQISEDYSDQVKVVEVCGDSCPENSTVFKAYDVRSVPVFMVFKGGEITGKITKPASRDELIQLVGL
ncbi:thioredoxin [Phormidium sp. FACHB-1136]|nr:thioredoxin [Phormidium sp. FACHB-1136]